MNRLLHNLVMFAAAAGLPLAAAAQTACPTFVVTTDSSLIVSGGQKVFVLSALTGVHMETNQGPIDITLLLDSAPSTCANFLAYVRAGRYNGTILHRSVPLSVQTQIGVIQGGGFSAPTSAITEYATEENPLTTTQLPMPIASFPPIGLEHPYGNVRGTLAMARTADPHSATSQFFINTSDNNTDVPGERFSLDAVPGQPGREGYAVFGVVTPPSLAAVDSIAFRPVMDISGILSDFVFGEVPLRRPYEEELTLPLLPINYVTIASATATATQASAWPMGAGLTYRWRRDGIELFDGGRFSGTGTPELTVDAASISDTGVYDCRVTGLLCGATTSEPATVRCPADLGAVGGTAGSDGALNNNDFIVFIDYFFVHDARADVGTTGGVPQADGAWDNNDFIVYIDAFFGGC